MFSLSLSSEVRLNSVNGSTLTGTALAMVMVGSLLTAGSAVADPVVSSGSGHVPLDVPVYKQFVGDHSRYWTPNRYRNARPKELPEVDPYVMLPLAASETDVPRHIEPGSKPTTEVEPDFGNRLFAPPAVEPKLEKQSATDRTLSLDPVDLAVLSSGPDGAHYTNSRVFPPEALQFYPYATAGKIFGVDPVSGGQFVCSGSVVARRLVATAGHCVYDAAAGSWFSNLVFVPAYDSGVAPFGVWGAVGILTTASWANGGNQVPNAADFAILVLDDGDVGQGPIGEITGTLPWGTGFAAATHVTMLGYPVSLDGGEQMQQTNSQTFALLEPNSAVYGSGLTGGSSGGPYLMNFGQPAAGQSDEIANVMVGIMSFGWPPEYQLAGTSILNEEWEEIFFAACDQAVDNC